MSGPDRHTLDGVEVDAVPPAFALQGYGVYTTFVAVDGSVLDWPRHLDRLTRGTRELWGHELDRAEVGRLVREHLRARPGAASVRVTAYPARLDLHDPAAAAGCRVLVCSGPAAWPPAPTPGLAVRSVEHARELAHLKATHLLTQVRLRREAQLAGYDDALLTTGLTTGPTSGARVLEGVTWSVLVWRGEEVATPDGGDLLDSVTVAALLEVATGLGRRPVRRPVRLAELVEADLVLAVNVHHPARPVVRLDEHELAVDQDLLAAVADGFGALPRDLV
ncbi:hypothetical protein GGQ22_09705 [Nocardioides sp. zg-579]|uniref:Aminotransferase IV n=1 Tax=Nocardioides marmotae TaxID=2663857 RepID=A0A6I3JBD5_9ACTN|nr:aminotransferase class IV [Nocardioides marmotae]MCR6031720.1 hypothetical protein [Gordonia jinghuaiqii]MTB95359.1 hypothetical protein [Nocardioides marmotae]QKE02183.1 hypothetical protein HPC71_14685 [Nocardioides marmotae]